MEEKQYIGNTFANIDVSDLVVNQSTDKIFIEFAKQFLASSVFNHDDTTKDWVVAAARSMYNFIEIFVGPDAKIRIFDSNSDDGVTKDYDWLDGVTIIEILNVDKPFIVDSATETIKSLGFEIEQRLNLVIVTERDANGKIINVISGEERLTNKNKESVVLFVISKITIEQAKLLHENLIQTLAAIKAIVQDWHPMLGAIDDAIDLLSRLKIAEENKNEFIIFLQWLKKGNFIFLGYSEYFIKDNDLLKDANSQLGIHRAFDLLNESNSFLDDKENIIYVTQSDNVSRVHRRANMDCIRIKELNENGNAVKERRFLGLFTSIVYYQDAQLIPIIRKKIEKIEKMSHFIKGGHNNKALISILQTFPRSELLHVPEEELFKTCIGMLSLSIKPSLKLFTHRDKVGLFLRCMLFIPNEQFSMPLWEKIQQFIINQFNAKLINENIIINETNLVRLQVVLKLSDAENKISDAELESHIASMMQSWDDNLKNIIESNLSSDEAQRFCEMYIGKFPESYKEVFSADVAFEDLLTIEKISEKNFINANLYQKDGVHKLKIYVADKKLDLFDMLPVIDNMAMRVIDHYNYCINVDEEHKIHIHQFILKINEGTCLEISDIKHKFQDSLIKALNKEIENDYYNSLIVLAGLSWNEVVLLRAIGNYLKQLMFNYSQDYIQRVLSKHPEAMLCLAKLFNIKFNPEARSDDENENHETMSILVTKFERILSSVQNLIDDKIIRAFFEVINATVRTNYYLNKNYISFKIHSSMISFLPVPKPFMEIYVYSNTFEGIHLRGGKVARGGLRWSTRTEDFRTEILSLLKSQMPKNAAIVPVGAKGGFIVKCTIENKKEYMAFVLECYRNFLRGLLDITDNIVDGNCKHPSNIIVHDGEDPYLVVAADKGTATFSDHANAISREYNFWLFDAFASGGSSGYDHKQMAITSQGAWISLEMRLWEKFNDMYKAPLKVIGIGDMSGDLFGNGMLASDNLQLLAAFNNLYIFIDPNPDLKVSFAERKRLFELEQSNWIDYDKELISHGGGVFSRSLKSIDITPQMKDVFSITENTLETNEFLKAILRAPVDFIWNGGIGTFIKASNESNDSVGDKSNDIIRVNGNQVKASIVVEGGNVGVTQLGRVEYSNNGGLINTDFIDNCAGVACSDMEVNIKIAFAASMRNNKISLEERNKILESMKNDVAQLILSKTNKGQAKGLIIENALASENLEYYQRLISSLEKSEKLNREVESFPSNEEIARMIAEKRDFERPHIAVLIAYSKMYLYDKILHSELPNIEYLNKYLLSYFPKMMQQKFQEEILHHPLKREIISTTIINLIVNRMGSTFVSNAVENSGLSEQDVIKILIAIFEAYKLDSVYAMFDELYGKVNINLYIQINIALSRFIANTAYWFFRNCPKSIDISLIVDEFSGDIESMLHNLDNVLDAEMHSDYVKYVAYLKKSSLSEEIALQLAKLEFMEDVAAIIQVNHRLRFNEKIGITLLTTGKIYFEVGRELGLKWVYDVMLDKLKTSSYWERLSIKVLSGEIYDYQVKVTAEVAKYLKDFQDDYVAAIAKWKAYNSTKILQYESFLTDIKASGNVDITKLIMISKRLAVITSC